MNKRILLIVSLSLLLFFVLVSAAPNLEKLFKVHELNKETTVFEYAEENVFLVQRNGQAIVSNTFNQNPDNLTSYISKARNRLHSKYVPLEKHVKVIVSFKSLVTENQIKELISKHGLSVSYVKFVSSEGGGKLGWPLDHGLIDRWEEANREELEQPNFKLIEGIYSISGVIDSSNLLKLSENPHILLVDIGPIEFLEKYPSATITPLSENIHYYYNELFTFKEK